MRNTVLQYTIIFFSFIIGIYCIGFVNSVSAQSQIIDNTPNNNDLKPIDPNAPKYAPDRVIVKYKEGQSPLALQKRVNKRTKQRTSFIGKVTMSFADLTSRARGQETPETTLKQLEQFAQTRNLKGQSISESLDQAKDTYVYEQNERKAIDIKSIVSEYKQLPQVEFAEPDYIVHALFIPNDQYYGQYQWALRNISAPQAWDLGKGSSDGAVKIAVIDSGIAWNHSDIDDKLVGVYDCRFVISCVYGKGYDYYTHGSHVAGIAAAETNNASSTYKGGIAGLGYNTKLITLKALNDDGNGFISSINTALYQLVNSYSGSHIVINMSIGSPYSLSLQNAITATYNAGFIIVAAAGNENTNTPSYPAGYSQVISVASIGPNNTKSSFSNYGSNWVDVAAPGEDILSTTWVDDVKGYDHFGFMSGTSMASPHVAGLAALVWAKNPSFTNIQIRNILQSTSDPISGTGTYWKYGKINAYQAMLGLPTPTNMPTNTPIATNTPIPTDTPTPLPTNTPMPTATATPTLTETPTPTSDPCPNFASGNADCSADGVVGLMDFVCWRYEYTNKLVAQNCGGVNNKKADFNNDGKTNLFDFVIWLAGFKANQ